MVFFRRNWAIGALMMFAASTAHASEAQNRKQRSLFMQSHPCPANGHIKGSCPGYLIWHVTPLCAGGSDRWGNMLWVAKADVPGREEADAKQCEEFKRLVESNDKKGRSK